MIYDIERKSHENRFRYYSRDRFICPECGEAVHLTGSKYSNHFTHFKKNDVSAEYIVVFESDAIIEILNEQNESIIQISNCRLALLNRNLLRD